MRRARAAGRALVAAGWLAALLLAPRAAAAPGDGPAEGFDHIVHEGDVTSRGLASPSCDRCHRIDPRGRIAGRPDHASCFGDCHGDLPRRPAAGRPMGIEPDRIEVCRACHAPEQLARLERGTRERIGPVAPSYPQDAEFAVSMSHAAHRGVPRGCRACHGVPGDGARPPPRRTAPAAAHDRCATCHARGGGGAVAMTDCGRCHTPAVGPTRAPSARPGRFPVAARFTHRKHLARTGGGGDPCATCHAGAASAEGEAVPTPDKKACVGCHDPAGRSAFSMVAPACTRCHAPPARPGPSEPVSRAAFSHDEHAATGCADCHALDRAGAPGPIGRGHAPCAGSGCHEDQFASSQPTICTTCHVRNEPWRDLHVDPRPVTRIDFGAIFSHRTHLAGADAPGCERCHQPAPGGRLPVSGHTACSGAGCHAAGGEATAGGGEAPAPLSACTSCHRRGLLASRERARLADRWSVRARFDHAPHRSEPGAPGRAVPCTSCHAVEKSEALADIPAPPKERCAPCHDGAKAFKLTGHSCTRCHGR